MLGAGPRHGARPGRAARRSQPKFDGYRAIVFTPWSAPGPLLVQSRRGSLLQSRFPDLVDAAADLPDGLVLDGELVVWAEEKMSFEALQRRAVSGGRTAARLAVEAPAHFIAFDVLQIDGQELLHVPYGERRARLEQLFADHRLSAPWTLCPETTDLATAQQWLTSWTQVPGVEGLVIRGSGQRYLPGARALYKVRRRDSTEAVVGAITGTVRWPQTLVLGRLDAAGALRPVGRSTPLRPDAARELAERLSPAKPGHPWEGVRFTTSWGSRTPLDVVLVEPSWSPRSWWTRRWSAGRGGTRCASPGSGWTSPSRTSCPSARAPSPPAGDRPRPSPPMLSGAGEDVVGANAAPDDVLYAGAERRPVLPGGASCGSSAHGPSELIDAGGALDALDAEAGAEVPAGAQVLNEGRHGLAEAAALFGGEAVKVGGEAGRGLVGGHGELLQDARSPGRLAGGGGGYSC
ncbi:ATP-dependent DNA ligase [Streptomyces lavendulocolor]|uniref:ATP-dependent DNA ligase n=1 Tax=Streptomyces lavendulocolor TaxID=67316 RepID=UPI003C2E9D31